MKNEFKIFSHGGEDGILMYLFSKVGTTNHCLVEFGSGPAGHNSANLIINHKWNGLLMDAVKKHVNTSRDFYNEKLKLESNRVQIVQCFITAENIEQVLYENGIPNEIDLLTIDVDGNDYWIWKAIKNINPRVVVIEYNSSIRPNWCVTTKYDPKFDRHRKGNVFYHGASLSALIKLGLEKGYCFVGCDSEGYNAFFVRKDVAKGKIETSNISDSFRPHAIRLQTVPLEKQFEITDKLDFEEV